MPGLQVLLSGRYIFLILSIFDHQVFQIVVHCVSFQADMHFEEIWINTAAKLIQMRSKFYGLNNWRATETFVDYSQLYTKLLTLHRDKEQ